MSRVVRTVAIGLTLLLAATPLSAGRPQQEPAPAPRPMFRGGVDRVGLTAVVRTRNGKPVTDLKQSDFELLDNGVPKPILEFRSEPTPATLALLVDLSGSMDVARKADAAREAASHVVAWLTPGQDQLGLFAFDTRLRQVEPIAAAPGRVLEQLSTMRAFGSTSLYDAVAETARTLVAQGKTHRAVVALTDGGENSSRLTAAEVSRVASEIDVPVYIIVVVSPFDRPGASETDDRLSYEALASGPLGSLARWTGGDLFLASSPSQTSVAARQIVNDLRHQYFIGFAPDTSRPGWHPIDLRLPQQKTLLVRARSGYVAQSRPGFSHTSNQ